MESITKENKDVDHGWRSRIYRSLCYLGLALGVIGCTTIKKAGVTATAAAAGATAGTVLSGGAIAPIAGSMVAASVASAVTDSTEKSGSTQPLEVTGDATIVQEAPDNFWTLLGKLTKVGGWALILVVIVPMLFSWLLPGPIQFKGKKGK